MVYGDLGMFLFYVYSSIFISGIKMNDDILGVFCFIIYIIIVILFVKYIFIVFWVNDNGEGM